MQRRSLHNTSIMRHDKTNGKALIRRLNKIAYKHPGKVLMPSGLIKKKISYGDFFSLN